jgi:hypothetical protein
MLSDTVVGPVMIQTPLMFENPYLKRFSAYKHEKVGIF